MTPPCAALTAFAGLLRARVIVLTTARATAAPALLTSLHQAPQSAGERGPRVKAGVTHTSLQFDRIGEINDSNMDTQLLVV